MTVPKVSTVKRGGSRFYVAPEDHQKHVPGVTSIIAMKDKPGLPRWSAGVVANTAIENLGAVVGLALNDPAGAVDYLKNAPYRDTKGAADQGSAAHVVFERLALGQPAGRVTPQLAPFVDGFKRFLDEKQPEYIHVEETVWNDTHLYAGSFDAYAIIDGERLFLDNKTTRSGVHDEAGIQLAAYRFSESIIRNDGTRVPTPEADGAAVLLIRPDRTQLVPIRADEEMFGIFLNLREVFRYEKEMKPNVIGSPVWEYYPDGAEPSGPKRNTPKRRSR